MKAFFSWGAKILALMVGGGVLSACTIGDSASDGNDSSTQVETVEASDSSLPLKELLKITQDVHGHHGGRIGIAVATGDGVVQVGELGKSPAWSTIKVPLAIAADRDGLVSPELIRAAISESDNDSAYVMSTLVEDFNFVHVPALGNPIGRTEWPLSDQAEFATKVECLDTHGTTFDSMGNIVEWQSWGLAKIPDAHYKGGWGLDTEALYTLRQFGVVPANEGVLGISILVHPEERDHNTAVVMVNEIGEALDKLISAEIFPPAPVCSA